MIGIRAVASGLVAVIGLAAAMGPGAPDPAAGVEARRLVVQRAEAALAALDILEHRLEEALVPARSGSTRIVSGQEPAGPQLHRAAEMLVAAEEEVERVLATMSALESARRAREPEARPVDPPLGTGELRSIAGQLDATAAAGETFAEMRARAERLPRRIETALTALQAGARSRADEAIGVARREHDALVAWEVGLPTLPVWLETTDAMISAVETIIEATAEGDAERAEAAADAFAGLAADAAFADRALRIAISEGGSALAAVALGRLASALARIDVARSEVAAILQAPGR